MKRLVWSLVGAAAIGSSMVPMFVELPTVIFWNASPSVPVGLYRLTPVDRLEVAQIVAIDPPDELAHFIAERGYLPPGTPLLKRVSGLPGQTVCRHGQAITVDGVEIGRALERDSQGRPMPIWRGCQGLANGQIFFMNPDVENSLDGRYFGPLPLSSVMGSAAPLWTEVEGKGRLRWQARCSRKGQSTHAATPNTCNRKDIPMAYIGQFTRIKDGFRGDLKTLTLDAALTLVPARQTESENAPDYRVLIGNDDHSQEIGAGWKRTGEKAGDYVSLLTDDPALPHPINANLFHSVSEKGTYLLTWNRPPKRRGEA